jgi:hypothetical protein
MTEFGKHCYKAACYETTRLVAESLNDRDDWVAAIIEILQG